MQSNSNLDLHVNIEDNPNEDNFEEECEDFPSETLVHNFWIHIRFVILVV